MSFYTAWGGGVDNTSGHSSWHAPIVTYGYGFPAGNPDSTGARPVRVDGVNITYVSGATGVVGYVGFAGAVFTTGAIVSSAGGVCELRLHYSGGTVYFGRNTANGLGTVDTGDGSSWVGGLVGGLYWSTAPVAPTMVSAVPGPGGTVTVTFAGHSDGGAPITGWVLQYDDNAGFTSPSEVASTGSTVLTLTPGKKYWFRAAGRNGVVDALGRRSAWSASISATMLAGGLIFDGASFVAGLPFIETAGANTWVPAQGFINTDGLNAWSPIG